MKALKFTGNFGTIARASIEQERQFDQLDRLMEPHSGSEKAVEDPVGYARDQ